MILLEVFVIGNNPSIIGRHFVSVLDKYLKLIMLILILPYCVSLSCFIVNSCQSEVINADDGQHILDPTNTNIEDKR